ncbi:MAG: hypothetical protein ACOZQL_34940 [Myxococcota bacterium]
MKRQGEAELPAALVALLDAITNRELARRLTDVLLASGRCLERLSEINLVALEPTDAGDGSADLGVWETMAPAVGETIVAANELCQVIDTCFPQTRSRDSLFGGEGSDERAEYEAAAVFRTISPLIRKEIQELALLVRRPELLSSPWALLAEIQRLRAQIRARVNDGVYLSAGALGAVSRDDVVPGYAQEVLRALSFRATESALRRTVKQRLQTATAGAPLAKAVEQDFEVLAAMPAWRHVKVETKRAMLGLRERLREAAAAGDTLVEEVAGLVKPMLDILEDTSFELSRGVLITHDRTARNVALRRAEQAELHLVLETGAAGWALQAAFDAAAPLRGVNQIIDELLRTAAKSNVSELSDAELMPLTAELATALTRLDL